MILWISTNDIIRYKRYIRTHETITYAISIGLDKSTSKHRARYFNHHHELAFEQAIDEAFHHHIIPFDESAAYLYGKIMGHRKQLGQSMSLFDGQIAATALSRNASLATRNINDFKHCGLGLINPFE